MRLEIDKLKDECQAFADEVVNLKVTCFHLYACLWLFNICWQKVYLRGQTEQAQDFILLNSQLNHLKDENSSLKAHLSSDEVDSIMMISIFQSPCHIGLLFVD